MNSYLLALLNLQPIHLSEPLPVILLLDNVRSLHNVGSLFRSADGAGIQRIILCGLTPVPPRAEITKTALGATHSLPWEYAANSVLAIKKYMPTYSPIALEQTLNSTNLYETALTVPLLLVVGHERSGISPEVLSVCQTHVHLPMFGTSAHSLNVSIAGSLALYELRRRNCYSN